MGENISVRIDKLELREIEKLSQMEKRSRSEILQDVFKSRAVGKES